MRKQIWTAALALLCVSAAAHGAAAQGDLPLSFEARIDAGIPLGDAADALETGVGFGLDGYLHLTPVFALYGGYSRYEFSMKELDDVDREAEGAEVGGRVVLGTGGGVWTPYAQVGALFIDGDTGFEAGLGALYPVGQSLSVTPMVRYRNANEVEYVTVGMGLNIRL